MQKTKENLDFDTDPFELDNLIENYWKTVQNIQQKVSLQLGVFQFSFNVFAMISLKQNIETL